MKKINTPFADKQVKASAGQKNFKNNSKYIIVGVALALVVGIGLFLTKGFTSDRYRTLESININELLDSHERLVGGEFKLLATVDNELGTENTRGKLVSFRDSESLKVVPVMINSGELASRVLSKGQRYKLEVEVRNGGLLYAKHFEKD